MSPNPGSGIFTSRSDPGVVVGGVVVVDGDVVVVATDRPCPAWPPPDRSLSALAAAAPPPAARTPTSASTTPTRHLRVCCRALALRPIDPPVVVWTQPPIAATRGQLYLEAKTPRESGR